MSPVPHNSGPLNPSLLNPVLLNPVLLNPVLLNNVDHHDLRVVTARGPRWGDAVNEVSVFPTEFEALSREYAILLRRGHDGDLHATVLLGLDRDENLFVEDGGWDARTVPALLQRGPFSIGLPAAGSVGEPMIHIDPDDPRISRHEGERLFLDHGGNAPYLDHVGRVLRSLFAGGRIQPAMIEAFAEAGLLEETTLELDLGDRRYTIADAIIVSGERFAALDASALARLHAGDFLRCAVWMLSSLGNLPALLDRKRVRDGRR